jgi:hypothetical protein
MRNAGRNAASADSPSFRHLAVSKLLLWTECMERFAAYSDVPKDRYRFSPQSVARIWD